MSDFKLSMFYVLRHGITLNPNAYQCDTNNLTVITYPRPVLGSYFLISGVILILLYIPCLIVMIKSKVRTPAFSIMMVLAIFDMLSLSVNSVITGILDIIGASFCHYPLFIFCSGALGLGSWMGGCVACILLAIDRCVEINAKFPLRFLVYQGHIKTVMIILISYWVYACLLTKPLLFTAEFSSWFFDPKIGKDPSLYHNVSHTINNLLVSAITTSLYIYLCIYLFKDREGGSSSMWVCRTKQQIIIQAVFLCTFHALAAYIYVYMQFLYAPPTMIIIGQLAWQWSNGCFCVVYLTLNRTIRNSVLKMILSKAVREKLGLHVGAEEKLEYADNGIGSSARQVSSNMVNVM